MGVRGLTELLYPALRGSLIIAARGNGERVHAYTVRLAQAMEKQGLTENLLGAPQHPTLMRFANAAGMNKDGLFPPNVLRALGFNVNIVGTVTNEPWAGNPGNSRIWYYPPGSLVNFLGLPGVGSAKVAETLAAYRDNGQDVLPVRVSVMSTPKKEGIAELVDIANTMKDLREYAKSWELNISCPNTEAVKNDSFRKSLHDRLAIASEHRNGVPLYIKLSPDMGAEDLRQLLEVCAEFPISGFTVSNTTLKRGGNGIPESQEKGGASGNAVYLYAFNLQKALRTLIDECCPEKPYDLNAVGGIDSVARMRERVRAGRGRTVEVQVYTGLTYKGPRLLRQLRETYE